MTKIPSALFSLTNPSGVLTRFVPQPKTSFGQTLINTIRGVAGVASGALGYSGIQPEYTQLIQQQLEVQKQMQLVSLISNVEKSKHETQMAAVRNIRAG